MVKISFSYTFPTLRFLNEERAPVGFDMRDFCEWIIQLKDTEDRPSMVVALSNGNFADIEWRDCMYDFDNGLYSFRLKKLRSDNIPAFTGMNTDSTDIILEENQFLGEFNLIVFDPHINRVIVQSNYFGLSIGQIELALSQMRLTFLESSGITFNRNDPGFVKLEFLVDNESIASLENSDIYRSINLRVADMPNLATTPINSNTLHRVIELGNELGGVSVNIQVSLSHEQKERSLDETEVRELIGDIRTLNENREAKLSVKARSDIESPLENIDVLLPKLTSIVELNNTGRSTLGMEYLYTQFKEQNYFNEEQHMQQRARLLGPV